MQLTALCRLLNGVIREIINPVVAILFTAAIVVFFWGMIQFIYSAGDDTKRNLGKQHMLWGVIGVFIMLSAFGILTLFTNTFGITVQTCPNTSNNFQIQTP